jgi:hypothetical protein
VVEANRALAGQLLAAADAWLFVTTAARYADAVPWDLLRAAGERGTALSLVLDRVPPEATAEVAAHLQSMLDERDLAGTPLIVIPEAVLQDGFLPPEALAPARVWLDDLAADAQARAGLVSRTLTGALESLPRRVAAIQEVQAEQEAAVGDLDGAARTAYDDALEEVDETVRGGSLLRGEVLARWHDVVGTGDLMRGLETRIGWLRDRVRSVLTGRRTPTRSCARRWRAAWSPWSSPPPTGRPSVPRAAGASIPPGGSCSPRTRGWTARRRTCAPPRRRPRGTGRATSSTSSARRPRASG